MSVDRIQFPGMADGYKIDKDILLISENMIDSYDILPEEILQPCFDSIWNACGFAGSLFYDKNGKRIKKI